MKHPKDDMHWCCYNDGRRLKSAKEYLSSTNVHDLLKIQLASIISLGQYGEMWNHRNCVNVSFKLSMIRDIHLNNYVNKIVYVLTKYPNLPPITELLFLVQNLQPNQHDFDRSLIWLKVKKHAEDNLNIQIPNDFMITRLSGAVLNHDSKDSASCTWLKHEERTSFDTKSSITTFLKSKNIHDIKKLQLVSIIRLVYWYEEWPWSHHDFEHSEYSNCINISLKARAFKETELNPYVKKYMYIFTDRYPNLPPINNFNFFPNEERTDPLEKKKLWLRLQGHIQRYSMRHTWNKKGKDKFLSRR